MDTLSHALQSVGRNDLSMLGVKLIHVILWQASRSFCLYGLVRLSKAKSFSDNGHYDRHTKFAMYQLLTHEIYVMKHTHMISFIY